MTRRTLAIVLALLHAYIGLRLLAPWDWPLQLAGGVALAALWVTLVSAVTPIFERREHSALLWAGLLGIGFFSSLFVLTLLREPVLLALRLAGSTTLAGWPVAAFTSAAVAGLALLASVVGFLNARRLPAVREVQVPIAGLPAALEGFTLVQISDLHVGLTIRRRFVQGVVERVNRLRADAVVVTGDSIDGLVHELHEHVAPLGGLQARHGVFAVTGNHEYYSGAPAWIDEFRRLGLDVLINEHRLLRHDGAALLLAGVPDWSAHHFVRHHRSDPLAALAGAPEGLVPKVLLAHQPRQAPAAAAAGFHLQLSGHTHGGQFLPWRWFVPLQQPYVAGLHRHEDLWIYTSRGTGYWGPPKRLGAPSEITRLRLVRAAAR